jgi:hypothetical protein
MIISPHAQQSVEWMIARAGIPTASEFDNLVTPEFKMRTGQMVETYLNKKLAEAWIGGPIASLNVFDVEQGRILEEEALPRFSFLYDREIKKVGLVTTDDGRVGCSPDGMFEDGTGIEVKCPAIHTHIGYLRGGTLPKDYEHQVHGSMYVTGAERWTFLSYRRKLPALVLTVERDEDIQRKLGMALDHFLSTFDTAWEHLVKLNGGPPKRLPVTPSEKPLVDDPEISYLQ